MLTLSFQSFPKFSWFNRRNMTTAAIVLGLPILLLILARTLATDPISAAEMQVSQAVLEEYVQRNPPNKTWQMTAIRVTDDQKLEMDVNVTNSHQAKVILSRSGRIRYSYLKLACPKLDAPIYGQLPKGQTVWVQLHHFNKPIVRGACPLASSLF